MTRLERLVVTLLLAGLVVALVSRQPVAGLLGASAGGVLGYALVGRLRRLRRRVDERLGADEPVPGRLPLRPAVVVRRIALQLGLLGILVLAAALVPFAGDDAFAAVAAAVTALPAVLTAERLLPRR